MPLAAAISDFAVGLAARLLQRLVDEVHAVITADREEVGVALVLGIVRGDEVLVQLGIEVVVVVPRRDDTERRIAHALHQMQKMMKQLGKGKLPASRPS